MITGEKSARRTERRLAALEGRLRGLYEHTADDMQKKSDAFFQQFERLDAEKRKKVDAGKLDAEKYKEWRKNKILYSQRFSDFQKKTAHELSRVNETALSYINGEVPPVYADNCNDFGKSISADADTKFDIGISFDLVDADTVRILEAENDNLLPELPPEKMLDIPLDERWNRQNMRTELAKGILEGESIPDISARMRKVVGMNHTSAVRNARTMVTAAQNGGRMEGMRRAEGMGIVLKRIWMSAEDSLVRKAHAELDGQTRSMDEPFVNALGDIMYPGDPHAKPANVYNCRCTLGTEIVGFRNSSDKDLRLVENNGIIEAQAKPIINAQKFTEYLLHTEKSQGKSKGFEQVFGFSRDNWHLFKAEIKKSFNVARLEKKYSDQYGDRYEQIMEITGVNGRSAFITTAWIVDRNSFAPRFVTAYLHRQE